MLLNLGLAGVTLIELNLVRLNNGSTGTRTSFTTIELFYLENISISIKLKQTIW
jgi:hypothetical protein